jgi:transcriptional regulator with XRE-family HTH domain
MSARQLSTRRKALRALVVRLLEAIAPNLKEVAKEAGFSYHTIRSYRFGRRTPRWKVLRALVRVLRTQANRLATLADELEAARRQERRKPQG